MCNMPATDSTSTIHLHASAYIINLHALTMRIKWLPLAGYTLLIFNKDQSNGLKIMILNRITEIGAYCPE